MSSPNPILKSQQRWLSLLGLYPGDRIDGLWGKRTEYGIGRFCELENVTPEQFAQALLAKVKSLNPQNFQSADDLLNAIQQLGGDLYLTMPEQKAYIMATAEWETAGTFRPVQEAYWLKPDARARYLASKPYGKKYWGRGLVQLTWQSNYQKYQHILNLPLLSRPDLALDPVISLFILVHGMKTGTFTGVGLETYINERGVDYVRARQIVNGMDRARQIAEIAQKWERIIRGEA